MNTEAKEVFVTNKDLKDFLSKQNKSIAQLSKEAGIPPATLSQLQLGYRQITFKQQRKLLNSLPGFREFIESRNKTREFNSNMGTLGDVAFSKTDILLRDPVNNIVVPEKYLETTKNTSQVQKNTKENNSIEDKVSEVLLNMLSKQDDDGNTNFTGKLIKIHFSDKYGDKFSPEQRSIIAEEFLNLLKEIGWHI